MATLAEYRAQIRSIGNFPTNDTRITDAVVNREINRALRRIAMVHDWPWLQNEKTITTVAQQATYTLPSDFLRLVSLRFVDNTIPVNLSLRSNQEVDEVPGPGQPHVYSIWNGKVKLAPFPVGTYTLSLRYIRQEDVLVNDTDAPLIPDYWDNGVIDGALVELYRTAARTDEASLAEQRFGQWVTETQDNVRQSREAPRVRVRPGSMI